MKASDGMLGAIPNVAASNAAALAPVATRTTQNDINIMSLGHKENG